jgi:hypothetical protein
LNAFKGVSVREESAKTILESQGIKDVEWVPDPSMLLTSDHYLRLVIDDDKYQTDLFVYYVNNSSVLSDQDVSLMLDETDGSYVFVGANNLYNKKLNAYPTVEEWLSYIYHDLLINCSNVSALKVTQLFTSIESARKWDEKTKEENSKSKIDKRTKKHILKEMRTVIENERYASILSEDEKTSILQRLPEIFRIPNSRELENIFINNGIALKGYEKRIISSRNIFLHGEVKFQEIC